MQTSRLVSLFLVGCALQAAEMATVRGVVHDPQHRPIAGAEIALQSASFSRTARSDANGEFTIADVPEGVYTIDVSAAGFRTARQQLTVSAAKNPVLHFPLEVAAVSSSVEVSEAASRLETQTSTVQTYVAAQEIAHTAGADQTNSLAMITDYTPGAYMVHDMLHMRGGHQVNWFFDGIPVVNTNIAANVAPLINPKNVQELEVERGGYSSQYGDRTYGFFNVVTPSGFERDNEADVVLSAGNFYSTDDQVSFGGHTERFAYYASADGNRSNLGLGTPVSEVIHDQAWGAGGFVSLLFNSSARNQFRWIASVRDDRYQVPNDPDAEAAGIHDADQESDRLVGFHWSHTLSDSATFSLAPYYHYNSAHFLGGPNDTPYILDDNARSNYAGGRGVLQVQKKRHNASIGFEVWGQHDNTLFGLTANPGGTVLSQTERQWASSSALFLEDQYRPVSWLTLNLGMRFTHYGGLVNENAADPRLGAAIRIPKLGWTLHGYYAYYYQPPPLDSLAGPALDFAVSEGFGFVPLAGERDIQHDIGLTVPVGGWSLDVDQFHTSARNFLDHDVVGDSGIFIPLTDLGAIIHGEEVTIRSPRLWHVAQWRVAYSNQIGQGIGPITGGLLEEAPTGNFLLDHDQRNTVATVLALSFPGGLWMTPAYQFGSGFLNGNGPSHLPPHSTFDLSIGRPVGKDWTISANSVNLGNARYLLDTSNTFGGTHYINPRQVYLEVRYRFHY
jgi:outer membrane receptor protein involved in Fe transport